jgi:hypothetical protein
LRRSDRICGGCERAGRREGTQAAARPRRMREPEIYNINDPMNATQLNWSSATAEEDLVQIKRRRNARYPACGHALQVHAGPRTIACDVAPLLRWRIARRRFVCCLSAARQPRR